MKKMMTYLTLISPANLLVGCAGRSNVVMKLGKLCILSAIALALLSTDAKSASPKCGDEIRVMTLDSLVRQGKLISNENDLFTLDCGGEIGELVVSQEDVSEMYLVRRKTVQDAVLGVLLGGFVGVVAGAATTARSRGLENINQVVTLIGAGILFGGIIGGAMGHSRVSLERFEVEAVPLCFTNSGELLPLKLNLSMNF